MRNGRGFVNPKYQQGLALLVFVIAIVLAVIGYIVSELTMSEIELQQQEKTNAALKIAKQALKAYVMNYPETAAGLLNSTQGPGNFPCPDDDFDGDSDNPGAIIPGCTSLGAGTIGRFPWAELGIEELRDGSGELLWYAISGEFVNATGQIINSSSTGGITIKNKDGLIDIDGTSNEAIIAVIISPGEALIRDDGIVQSRKTAADLDDPRNYLDIAFAGDALEEDNASYTNNDANGFIRGPVLNAFNQTIVNDQIEIITYGEIMDLVKPRVASEVSEVLNNYKTACGVYPDASEYNELLFNPATNDYDDDGFLEGHVPDTITPPDDWNAGCAAGITLPTWFDNEGWHENTYYQFVTTPCTPGLDCIELMDDVVPLRDDIEAILVFAERAVGGQDRVTFPVTKSQYFENENSDSDNVFDINEPDDYIWVVSP